MDSKNRLRSGRMAQSEDRTQEQPDPDFRIMIGEVRALEVLDQGVPGERSAVVDSETDQRFSGYGLPVK